MPQPRFGRMAQEKTEAKRHAQDHPASPTLSSAAEDLLHAPQPEVLGTIPAEMVQQLMDSKDIPPPPWAGDRDRQDNDGRRFVDAPSDVVLHWLNPKLVQMLGFRYWQPVPAQGDQRFRMKNSMMIAPDNTVRRGGHEGDILAWMYRPWYDDLMRRKHQKALRARQSAVDRTEETKDHLRRGSFGPYIRNVSGQAPTATAAEGQSLDRD